MMKTKILILILGCVGLFTSCSDILDRPEKNNPTDEKFWVNEDNLRLFANGFYEEFFTGYNYLYRTSYVPVRGYNFSDDVSTTGVQSRFENAVPSARGSMNAEASAPEWLRSYSGQTYYLGWIVKSNTMIDRIETRMGKVLTAEQKKHWLGVARFFRGLEYSRIVSTFGDFPYYDKVLGTGDDAELFKDRDPRNFVMDKVYEDFKFALENIRTNDGDYMLDRYTAAGFISRWMLFEGTWQKYHQKDDARAQKFLEFAQEASEFIMNTSKFSVSGDFKSLFTSSDLTKHPEVLFSRRYSSALGVTHAVASYCNLRESQSTAINLAAVKAFICNDGKPYQNSGVADAKKFDLDNLVKTRDPRFEATFHNKPSAKSVTLLYSTKFMPREPIETGQIKDEHIGDKNTTAAPVMRYSEVLLNWIEAKAVLQELGKGNVTQSDITLSINALRNRDLDQYAIDKGVQKTKGLELVNLPDDPERDADVSPLLWEIRRERRMEFIFEHSRLQDLRRWKKLEYMNNNNDKYTDYKYGVWADLKKDVPEVLGNSKIGVTRVMKEDGTIVVFDGSNDANMVGYYMVEAAQPRDLFDNRVYLSPVGKQQIDLYARNNATLTQTTGW